MIKNYTSTVPAETSISRIEAKLAAAGANGIMKMYGPDKRVTSLVFRFDLQGRAFSFRIPANTESCFAAMWKEHCLAHSRPRPETQKTIKEQAARTAWKIVSDWVEIQITMIVLKQAEFLEVFLPYAWDGKQTFFEAMKANQYKQIAYSE